MRTSPALPDPRKLLVVTRTITLLLVLAGPPPDPWFGVDKLKHFLLSGMVQCTSASLARSAGIERNPARMMGAVLTVSVGVGRELHDRRSGKSFSVKDLVWDALGGTAAVALLNGAR